MLLELAKILDSETCAEMKSRVWELYKQILDEKIKYYRNPEVKK